MTDTNTLCSIIEANQNLSNVTKAANKYADISMKNDQSALTYYAKNVYQQGNLRQTNCNSSFIISSTCFSVIPATSAIWAVV